MKIDKAMQPVNKISVNDGKKRVDTTSSSKSGQVSENTQVHISSQASQLRSAQGSPASGAVIDTARVQEIKQAISEGNFKVNPEVVADRLLETVRELIQSKKGEG